MDLEVQTNGNEGCEVSRTERHINHEWPFKAALKDSKVDTKKCLNLKLQSIFWKIEIKRWSCTRRFKYFLLEQYIQNKTFETSHVRLRTRLWMIKILGLTLMERNTFWSKKYVFHLAIASRKYEWLEISTKGKRLSWIMWSIEVLT